MLTLQPYLTLAAIVFGIGVMGIIINRKKNHYFIDVYRIIASRGQFQFYCFFLF
ncbi:MAG: hypothetical protein Ct9H300mP4_11700 [Gammaproteobacteria bacterium]|nr:MAG: hypothetical protein Ct9H300mP4_11700 [Gammaproteobacteria bacterium]